MNAIKKENAIVVKSDVISKEMFDRFTTFLDVAPLTVKAYKSGLKRFAEFVAVNGIKNPCRDDVLAFKSALLEHGRKPSTIALYLTALKRFFSWTESEGLYSNITTGIKAPKISKSHKKDCFTGNQIKEILKGFDRSTAEGARNFAVFSLMACCGLRTIEIARARIEDLRSECGVNVLYIQGKGRTEKSDFVKIPEAIRQAIQDYIKIRGKAEATDYLFTSESKRNHGGGLTTRTISGICKSAMLNAGFNSTRLTAHSLRHTAITLALLNGADLSDVQAFARHNSINTTMIYNHSVNRLKSNIENSIANSIF